MTPTRWLTYERAIVIALFAFGALVFAATFSIDTSTASPTDVGPTFVPGVFAGLLMLCSLFAVFFAKPPADDLKHPFDIETIAMLALVIAYAVAMPVLGYVASTFLTMIVALLIVRAGAWWRIGVFALGMTAATWFVFAKLLLVGLPPGPWGF